MREIGIGDYGRVHFTIRKKGMSESRGFNLVAKVIDIDNAYVMLKDNDDIEYLVKKRDIIKFRRRHERKDIMEDFYSSSNSAVGSRTSDLSNGKIQK